MHLQQHPAAQTKQCAHQPPRLRRPSKAASQQKLKESETLLAASTHLEGPAPGRIVLRCPCRAQRACCGRRQHAVQGQRAQRRQAHVRSPPLRAAPVLQQREKHHAHGLPRTNGKEADLRHVHGAVG